MFHLDQTIAEWRRQMLAAGIKTPVPLEELESHLREDFEAQVRAGAIPERAYEIAVSRLGLPATLQQEFRKMGEVMKPWERKLSRVISGGATIALGLGGLVLLTDALRARTIVIASVAGALLSAALPLGAWPIFWGFFPVLPEKPIRLAVEFLCLVLSVACGAILLRLFTLQAGTADELVVATAWAAIVPITIGAALVFGLEEAAYRNAQRRT